MTDTSTPPDSLLHISVQQNNQIQLEFLLQHSSKYRNNDESIPQGRQKIYLKKSSSQNQNHNPSSPPPPAQSTAPNAASQNSHIYFDPMADEENSILFIEDNDADNIPSCHIDHQLLSETPLHYAAFFGRAQCFDILLQYGAKLNITNQNGETPLHIAATYGRKDILNILLEAKQWKALQKTTLHGKQNVLHLAALCARVEILRSLIQHLKTHARHVLNALLEQHDANGEAPIHIAVRKGELACTEALLMAGAKSSSGEEQGDSIQVLAVQNLLDSDGRTPLHIATMHNHLPLMKMILQMDPQLLNKQDSRGWTALHIATMLKLKKAEKFLKKCGASPEIANHKGLTSTQFASLEKLEEEHKKFMEDIGGSIEDFEAQIGLVS